MLTACSRSARAFSADVSAEYASCDAWADLTFSAATARRSASASCSVFEHLIERP